MKELNLIYRIARMANVPAETHEAVAKATQEIAKLLEPKKEPKKVEKKK